MIIRGKYVVLSLFALTFFVGAFFVFLGPKALNTSPGVLHLGIRYSDERSVDFTRHPKGGPNAKLIVSDLNGKVINVYDYLKLGRNLIPIKQNIYTNHTDVRLLLVADGYKAIALDAMIIGRTIKPKENNKILVKNDAKYEPNEIISKRIRHPIKDYTFSDNMIGARLYRINN
tara:strand:+ start:127 stop:645 length:519 start_codon:yes stop_codon:yes gene_type:complete